jgi:hypothetical protein
MTVRALTLIAMVLLSQGRMPGVLPRAEAAGPWRAQVVSADTKQPLEGVIVLAWWTRHVRSFGGPSEEYRDSQEVLTDKDGRFTIESRWFFSLNPLVFFRGPFIAMFNPGYGRYEWPGFQGSEMWSKEKRAALRTEAQLLQLDGIVLEMPTLTTSGERTEYLKWIEVQVGAVPLEKRPLMQSALVEERKLVR